ncbi:hypothetical protein [Bacillus licheniformis]|uniref:hypothetical protein n=1 Tax=Bacillus licheniformis TaxID=1402 RepID=UPI000925E8AC|nr:hypothetical protein [Bacillus licheniformis]OJT57362.1 hypothetical protein BFP47_11680 [Bacillus licheniformis]OJT69996.1 hypothetical protein BFP46_05210 [Bacillus licheniformis]
MTIEPLKRIIVNEGEEGIQTARLPNNQEMMNKINEVIKYVNMIGMKVAKLEERVPQKKLNDSGFKPKTSR